MAPDHVTHFYTVDAANADTKAVIDYMMPTWKSNARRYGLNARQTESHIRRMISKTIAERQEN